MSGSLTIRTERDGKSIGLVQAMFESQPDNTVVIRYPKNDRHDSPPDEVVARDIFFSGVLRRLDGTVDILAIRGR